MKKPLSTSDLDALSARTLAHYDASAQSFREGTHDHDVSQNYQALLRAIEGVPPFSILDFGCGPGRDLAHFKSLGHEAVGVEGAAHFVQMARTTGCEVLHQRFLRLSLPAARFHGVFANASLFHVPTQELGRVLGELRDTLRPRGVLFVPTRTGPTPRGSRASATAPSSHSRPGPRASRPRDSTRSSTTTGRRAGREPSSPGSPRSGERTHPGAR